MKRVIAVAAGAVALGATPAILIGTSSAGGATLATTPTEVSAYNCIVANGGNVTRPAGSTIVIRQGLAENSVGVLRNLLGAQTTLTSVNDAPMFDVSDQWGAPAQQPDGSWLSVVEVPTGVTLANPGDSMRFTFSLVISGKVPEAGNGVPGQPAFNGPGLAFGGTCTVTAT